MVNAHYCGYCGCKLDPGERKDVEKVGRLRPRPFYQSAEYGTF